MAGKPPDPLKASVRRALFWRVVAGTLLIAVVMALVVYGLERNRIGEAVVAYALHRASIFNDETGRLFDVPGLPDRQLIQSKLEASSEDRPDTPWGRFVLVEVYRTPDDPARHKETAHYQAWRDTVAEMMAEPRSAIKYDNVFPDDTGW